MRFPGFERQWETKKLGEICKIYDGTHQTPRYVQKGIPFYSVEHITADNFENTKYISNEVYEKETKRVKIEKGDILMTRIGSIGVPKYINWDVKASFYVSVALIKQSSKINTEYLNHFISSSFFQNELWTRTIHVAFPKKINLGEIGSCEVYFPSSQEQQKTAAFLSKIDARISTQIKTIEEYKLFKKGMMQKIFAREIRFKDENGKVFPEWQEKRLGAICKKKSSNISANSLAENTGKHKIYGATGFLQSIDFYKEEKSYISIVKDGAGVGRTLLCEAKSSVLGTLDVLRPTTGNDIGFLHALLSTIHFEKYITGSTIPHIYFKDYSKEKVFVPQLKEQQKIASTLSAIDKKIDLETKLLEALAEQKKYFLQNLFI